KHHPVTQIPGAGEGADRGNLNLITKTLALPFFVQKMSRFLRAKPTCGTTDLKNSHGKTSKKKQRVW
ncbi:hypothetical protein, partial [Legionella spiritensis]|uniref:hypothetical protein n=1 Tax=Legionella spiritensis TaxID=452 RepID=UPI000730BFE6